MIFDVDCHLEVSLTPQEHPLRRFADRFPSTDEDITHAIAGELYRATPEDSRPPAYAVQAFLPDANRSASEQATVPGEREPRFVVSSVAERLGWMDRIGIDKALVNPGSYFALCEHMGDDRPLAVTLCNDFLAERLEDGADRLFPVSMVDFSDLDRAVRELTWMRARGSRAFWIRAEPAGGVSPAHPDWDKIWSAATSLGMVAILHVGNAPANFDGGWGNAGWLDPTSTGVGGFFSFANSMRHHTPEKMLAAMLFGGVFGRHPNLTVLCEEIQNSWFPSFVTRIDRLSHTTVGWPFERSVGEMVRHNVRSSPLIGMGDLDVAELLTAFPEVMVFSSDYPHGEGNADPITLIENQLGKVPDDVRARFLGDNITDVFARMGDPVG
ncbi:amidohydrolase family protein [Frankia sp. CNm7]|uniref:Amidohydrolase family protein n=1 Tax=Frankia nepalensis TaxID=1836974 RepID=A0A937RK54_9ACTN|nr:amidohydrolase family protein [Frankia nepalensis]MBL7496677.1 amidohydrolase family protein [Frankia nepalensis]MBL7510681.1 amidohydrolase family protein [Frankia nepalensis]MBL7516686.1 amidohydrolase family protein [Frankia nepalensis]MBL7627416.1 amidohydrolase family protein [Frankia nepalensis]